MAENESIYEFPKIRAYLENHGITIGKAEVYKRVSPGDITIDSNGNLVGDVSLDENEMFVIKDASGAKRNVFLVKKVFSFYYNGTYKSPKAHLCYCSTIRDFGKGAYRYANELPVVVMDKDTGRQVKIKELDICSNCKKMLHNDFVGVQDVAGFTQVLKDLGKEYSKEEVDVTFSGYIKDWEKISKAFRETQKYRCDKCGIDLSDFPGRLYCQTHHKNGNKLDNQNSNLQCLCVQCHSEVDDRHRENFNTEAQQVLLKNFMDYKRRKSSSNGESYSDNDRLPF